MQENYYSLKVAIGPFIITAGTMVDYAHKRVKEHIGRFNALADQIDKNEINKEYINYIYSIDNIFPEIDYSVYSE